VVSAVYPKEGAAREVSVITASKTIDLKHNYFGVFPKALDVITLGSSNAADIQGFTGVPFDSNWTKGPYYGGEYLAGDTTWLTDIFITGDLTITSGKTLTISEGVNVLFANVDQNKDGTGDYGIFVSGGGLVVNGTSGNPVTFTVYGATKSPKSWDVVEIAGGGASSNVANAIFEYGNAGLRLQSGTHQLNAVTSRYQSSHGFQFISGTSLAADKLTASENGGDGIYLSNFSNATIDHSTITKNGGNGVSFYNSTTNLKLKNSTITYNAASGLLQQKSGVSVDHCNINYNGTGVKYAGNSTGSLGYCNVKYNNNEGIFLQTLDSYSPSPAINNNNVYGNSVIEGGKFADPGVSVSTTGSDYMTKASSPYTTPANQKIHYFQANYSEYDYDYYNYENGNVRKDS
ncbi:MAG: right-handed parallel beta-helix repeat-containing protein, partial [Deltaproteobacteria bacterium]|nr:right-handed parallel beta-helix repeat-containing protein [Deltaproteobacteria bacterium]